MSKAKIDAIFYDRYPHYDDWQSDNPDEPHYISKGPRGRSLRRRAAAFGQMLEDLVPSYLDELYDRIEAKLPTFYREKISFETRRERLESPESQPDYDHWLKCDLWTIEEACALALGKDPDLLTGMTSYAKRYSNKIMFDYKRIVTLAERWTEKHKLGDYIKPMDFVEWAIQKEIDVPVKLRSVIEPVGSEALRIKSYQKKIAELENKIEKTTRYTSALKVIVGLAIVKYEHKLEGNSPAASSISKVLPDGLTVDATTLRTILGDAAGKFATECKAAVDSRNGIRKNPT